MINDASKLDPIELPTAEGCVDVLSYGFAEIENIFVKLYEQLEKTKAEMKDRLKEAYKADYRARIDNKS